MSVRRFALLATAVLALLAPSTAIAATRLAPSTTWFAGTTSDDATVRLALSADGTTVDSMRSVGRCVGFSFTGSQLLGTQQPRLAGSSFAVSTKYGPSEVTSVDGAFSTLTAAAGNYHEDCGSEGPQGGTWSVVQQATPRFAGAVLVGGHPRTGARTGSVLQARLFDAVPAGDGDAYVACFTRGAARACASSTETSWLHYTQAVDAPELVARTPGAWNVSFVVAGAQVATAAVNVTGPALPSPAAATATAVRFYRAYVRSIGRSDTRKVVQAYGTAALVRQYDHITDYDTFVCAQNVPSKVAITGRTTSPTSFQLQYRGTFGSGSSANKVVVGATVTAVRVAGKVRIARVACLPNALSGE